MLVLASASPWRGGNSRVRFRCATKEVVGTGPGTGGSVARIEETAAFKRETAAADAPGQFVAQCLELGDCHPHADEADTAARRVEDRIGDAPTKLLSEFQAHGFLALDPIRLLERRYFEPALHPSTLGNDATAIADQAVDESDACPHGLAFDGVRARHVSRHEKVGFEAGPSRVRGKSARGISCGRGGKLPNTQFVGHGYRNCHAASLESAGRIRALVLDEQPRTANSLSQSRRSKERRHAFAERD